MGNNVILEHYHVPILLSWCDDDETRNILSIFISQFRITRTFALVFRSLQYYIGIHRYLSQHRLPPITSNCITCLHVPGYVCCILINHILIILLTATTKLICVVYTIGTSYLRVV